MPARLCTPDREEHLTGELLAHLARQIGRTKTSVEAGHVSIRLLEAGVFTAGQGQVGHHVEAVTATDRPAGHHSDDHFGHKPDQTLDLKNVETACPGRVHRLGRLSIGVAIAVFTSDPLITARTERPAAVTRRRPVSCQQHCAHVRSHPRMVQHPVKLVDGVWPEGISNIRAVKGHPNGSLVHGPVIGHVRQIKSVHGLPSPRIERLRDSDFAHGGGAYGPLADRPEPVSTIATWETAGLTSGVRR